MNLPKVYLANKMLYQFFFSFLFFAVSILNQILLHMQTNFRRLDIWMAQTVMLMLNITGTMIKVNADHCCDSENFLHAPKWLVLYTF